VAKALGEHNIVLLVGHGAAAVSTHSDASAAWALSQGGPEACVQKLISLEELCKITWLAFSAVGKDYEKYGISETTYEEGRSLGAKVRMMSDRYATPGKDMIKDQCYYNAAMAKTFREAVEG